MSPSFTRVIVHQFDPENPAQGGVDTCLRDMLRFMPIHEKVLVVGSSDRRPLGELSQLTVEGRGFHFLPVARVNPGNQKRVIPHSIRMLIGALRYMSSSHTVGAVLQYHRLEFGLIARMYRSPRRVYFIHTNTAMSLGETSDSFWRRAPALYRILEFLVLKSATLTVVFNRPTYEALSKRRHRVVRARTWFNDKLYRSSAQTKASNGDELIRRGAAREILWVGRLESPKNPSFALDVIQALNRDSADSPKYHLTVVGDGTLYSKVLSEIERRNLTDQVVLEGSISPDGVALRMRTSDVLLMTSYFEGSPRVLYEALGTGLPVVASTASDPDEALVVGSNGITVDGYDAIQYASAIPVAMKYSAQDIVISSKDRRASAAVPELWMITGG